MSQASSKKRKPNAFEGNHTPSKKQRKQLTPAKNKLLSPDPSTLVSDEVPFKVECPARKVPNKGKKQAGKDDVFGPALEDGGFPNLTISYAIRPGKAWAELKIFRNFSIQNQKFSTGSLVYLNKHTPPPAPPDTDASEADILAFDKKNLWVGQVLEVRAANSSEVWLRVFWLYWPEELPKGRRKYHGSQELIMSNHMELVDAKSVTSRAEINHWDEKVEDQDVGQRFWRQFYDVQLAGSKSEGLSTNRRHCLCEEYYNPDKTMLKCPNRKCGIWNHQECLEQAILKQTYGQLVGDQNPETEIAKGSPASKVTLLKSGEWADSREQNGRTPKGKIAKAGPIKKSTKQPSAWEGLLKADITMGERGAPGAFVTITDDRAQDPEIWTESIQCLKCGTPID